VAIIKIGLGRLYNTDSCSLRDEKAISFSSRINDITVETYIGPETKHIILSYTIGPARPIDPAENQETRAKSVVFPPPETFPADLYVELVAT
jgi:hypothetical protein